MPGRKGPSDVSSSLLIYGGFPHEKRQASSGRALQARAEAGQNLVGSESQGQAMGSEKEATGILAPRCKRVCQAAPSSDTTLRALLRLGWRGRNGRVRALGMLGKD